MLHGATVSLEAAMSESDPKTYKQPVYCSIPVGLQLPPKKMVGVGAGRSSHRT